MKKIAVTGAYRSGKSTFCQALSALGATVVDADDIAHELLEATDREAVIELLGPEIVTDGQIDRQKVAQIVFKNKEKLKALEQILHPHILEHINTASAHATNHFIAEVPLLFEAGWEGHFDLTVCITRGEEESQEYQERMANQFPQKIKAEKSDIVISNDGTAEQLQSKAKQLYKEIDSHV